MFSAAAPKAGHLLGLVMNSTRSKSTAAFVRSSSTNVKNALLPVCEKIEIFTCYCALNETVVSKTVITEGMHRSVVACLIRASPDSATASGSSAFPQQNTEMFFVLRALNDRDRWSGQVGFPGGHGKIGEDDEAVACREVWEEVGLDLKACEFELVGKLPDLRLDTRNKTMNVACLVYYLPPGKSIPPLNCDPKEVRAAGWAPLGQLTADKVYAKKMTLEYMAKGFAETGFFFTRPEWVRSLGLMDAYFTHIKLPIGDRSGGDQKTPFRLWGLTLNFVNEIFFRYGIDRLVYKQPVLGTDMAAPFESSINNIVHQLVVKAYDLRAKIDPRQSTERHWSIFMRRQIEVVHLGLFSALVGGGLFLARGFRARL